MANLAPDLPHRLYTLAEVAQVANVSQRTLYMWIKDDYLQAVKVGGRWRVDATELEALMTGSKGTYKRRVYKAGKPVGYTREARARKHAENSTQDATGAPTGTKAPQTSPQASKARKQAPTGRGQASSRKRGEA